MLVGNLDYASVSIFVTKLEINFCRIYNRLSISFVNMQHFFIFLLQFCLLACRFMVDFWREIGLMGCLWPETFLTKE
ncbi:MAG: hypothetical protein B6D76_18755 [gamma proteobacterium symbiont of Stewartia floridana]|nr:MAG: hypothetical protein B6D76_18755 [gamma proteobacterium symbiont of Stewartia floridana]RLW60243.1 MAG: hypothetical protein B6D75_06380 [gamma proteobacterium symbiont of Stewartia floridana]RLW64225.1 MAG: hypothetical protein B6D73_11785 [gamma proteobacterium symbiont of Stewartia floridana]